MLRLLWPAGLIPVAIWLAALTLGADQPAASLMFSALLLALCAAVLAAPGSRLTGLGALWLAGALALFLVGLVRGWASTGAGEYASLTAGAGIFIAAQTAGRQPERARALWMLILALGAGLGLAAFIDFFIDPDTVFGHRRTFGFNRLSAPFLSANTAASFYGMIALMALADLLRALRKEGRIDARIQRLALPVSALLVCASCLLLSGSRAGVSLFMVAALLLLGWDRAAAWRRRLGEDPEATKLQPSASRGWRRLVGPGLLIAAALLVFGVSGGLYIDRIEHRGLMVDNDARSVMFARYLDGVWLAPLFGAGLGGFEFINDFLATGDHGRVLISQNAAHNVIFQWLLQTGILGASAALGVLLLTLSRLRQGLTRRRRQRLLLRTILVIAVFVFAHGMVDYALEIPALFWLFAILLGLGVGIADAGRSRQSASNLPVFAKPVGVTILLISACVCVYIGLDRNAAVRITRLSDSAFSAQYSDPDDLSGSAIRLEAIGDRALRLDPLDPALARAAFFASLDRESRNGKVWAKAAYANYLIIPIIAGETENALRQSYYLTPYAERGFIEWRLGFMATIWPGLPEDLRSAAEREARILPPADAQQWRERVSTQALED